MNDMAYADMFENEIETFSEWVVGEETLESQFAELEIFGPEGIQDMVDIETEDTKNYEVLYYDEILKELEHSRFMVDVEREDINDYDELYYETADSNLSIDLEISYDGYTGVIYDEFFYDEEDGDEFYVDTQFRGFSVGMELSNAFEGKQGRISDYENFLADNKNELQRKHIKSDSYKKAVFFTDVYTIPEENAYVQPHIASSLYKNTCSICQAKYADEEKNKESWDYSVCCGPKRRHTTTPTTKTTATGLNAFGSAEPALDDTTKKQRHRSCKIRLRHWKRYSKQQSDKSYFLLMQNVMIYIILLNRDH